MNREESVEPRHAREWLERAKALLGRGFPLEAVAAAQRAQALAGADPQLLDMIGGLFNLANDHERALAAYDAAVALVPDNAHLLFNRAAVRRFLGQLEAAEADYDRVIALSPGDHEAYRNRADLRTQTRERNHVAELEALLRPPPAQWRGEVQLRYALAKELEDLGEYERAFAALQAGARKRREFLSYEVATDVATADWISAALPQPPPAAPPGASTAAPIFIVGLPRSGTTLVDRILSSHSRVNSAGELNYFALCVVDAVARRHGPAARPRQELVALAADVDFAALGHDYLGRAARAGFGGQRFVDKMPLNYLYCGWIRRALPAAKIVHLTRHPLAVCYAMYKTLFAAGYPFSYDLDEIAQYYLAYRRLMDHWRRTLPDGMYELSYENLVADQLGETRRLLSFCGLEWEDACVDFHRNPGATTTQSASQVRRRIYASSVAQWRHYERQLAPLRDRLAAAGIDLENPTP